MERFTGISRGQWSSSQIFLVQSRVYAINLLFATVVLEGKKAEEVVKILESENLPPFIRVEDEKGLLYPVMNVSIEPGYDF